MILILVAKVGCYCACKAQEQQQGDDEEAFHL